ncbi:MAG: hypothetical protein ACP5G1_02625 [Nanopusillaceae archaeon]
MLETTYLILWIIFTISLGYVYLNILKMVDVKNLFNEKNKFILIKNVSLLFFPFIFLISYALYYYTNLNFLLYVFSIFYIILFYFSDIKIYPEFIFLPLIFYYNPFLFYSSLFFVIISKKEDYNGILVGFIFYTFLFLSNIFTAYEILVFLIPYFVLVLITYLLEKDMRNLMEKYSTLFIIPLIFYIMKFLPSLYQLALVILSIILTRIFKWDYRIFLIFSIYFLILAGVLYEFNFTSFADLLGYIMYWGLIITIVDAVIESIKEKETKSSQ